MTLAPLLMAAALTLAAEAPSSPTPPPPSQPAVFDLPQLQANYMLLQAAIGELFRRGQYADAEKACRKVMELVPHDPNGPYNLACALARQGKLDEAAQSLDRAVALGFNDVKHIQEDQDLAALRERDDFKKTLEKAATAKPDPNAGWKWSVAPAAIEDGVALVTEKDTAWDARLGVFRTLFKFADKPEKPIANGLGEAGDLLRTWYEEGTAAGNHGDLYDNHDSDHSNMGYGSFPQLARIEFSDAPKAKHLHHGVQLAFFYNAPTLGNSSTAVTSGPLWRSQARLALTQPRGPVLLYLQYVGNHLYVYPEHRDHDPGHNGADGKGHGDVFPANTPYMIISQGSSGSDVVFLNAVAATMAAFRPEVKAELVRTGTLVPAVQMIFRSSNKMVQKPEDYLTGKAHPTVFDGGQVDVVRMVRMAHDIRADALPPMIQLTVVEEDQATLGVDYCDAAERERLFDTPCAIARVVRSLKYQRRMVVSAEASRDLKDKPLTYHWTVLRGDADRIKINKLNDAGSVVELLVPYHERRPIAPGSDLESNRVDIGAFVSNGTYYSAPGFVSFLWLDNEKRVYDDQQRIKLVDYADPVVSKNYVDPTLDLPKGWRDEYQYDASGRLLGWLRFRGDQRERFTADGALVIQTDDRDRPIEARRVRYVAQAEPNKPPVLKQQTTEETVRYQYASPDDRVGHVLDTP